MKDKLLIYEFDCLNTLLLTDRKILKKVFSNIIVPRVAYYEFRNRLNDGILQTINSLKRSKFIVLEDFEVNTPEYQFYNSLKKGIECKCRGKCESAAITIALQDHLTILSNHDGDYTEEYNLNRISMIELLTNSYKNNLINMDEAELLWSNMLSSNIIKNKTTFEQYYINRGM